MSDPDRILALLERPAEIEAHAQRRLDALEIRLRCETSDLCPCSLPWAACAGLDCLAG